MKRRLGNALEVGKQTIMYRYKVRDDSLLSVTSKSIQKHDNKQDNT